MPSFTIMVPNNDDGHDLGEYEADYLPRVGDPFSLMHPRLNPKKHHPFVGTVSMVTHEAYAPSIDEDGEKVPGYVNTTVWLIDEAPAPELFCDCTEAERAEHPVVDGKCDNCGYTRQV